MNYKYFTSESVGKGHPDKICDQIADAILDRILQQDPEARVACEVMASNRLIVIGGEITTTGYVDVTDIAWKILNEIGYSEDDFTIISNIHSQSIDIKKGVDKKSGSIGAGDQGIVFGYACRETQDYLPLPIVLAHSLVQRAELLRHEGKFKWAKADLKAQVTIDYQSPQPKIATMLMSVQHEPHWQKRKFAKFIKTNIMDVVAKQHKLNLDYQFHINPAGNFTIGGPVGDTGLTGRKLAVDTYGGKGRHGGGAFSGKDYTKVDRSGAYAARWVAKNIVAANLADEVEVQIAYGIGLTKPIAIDIETFGTNKVKQSLIKKAVTSLFDLTPQTIIEQFNLKRPIYKKLAVLGHFGRPELKLPWEKLDKVKELQTFINNSKIKK